MSFDTCERKYREGMLLENKGQLNEGLKYFIRRCEDIPDDCSDKAFLLFHSGRLYSRMGQYGDAKKAYNLAMAYAALLSNSDRARIHNELAFNHYRQNELELAFIELMKAKEMLKGEECSALYAQNLHYHGLFSFRKSHKVEAMESLRQALAVYGILDFSAQRAQVLDTMGMIFSEMGEMEEAVSSYQESLRIKEEIGDEYGIAITCGNLGRSFLQKMEMDEAIRYFERDRALCEKMGDEFGLMVMLNNLGRAYMMKKDGEKGIVYLEKSMLLAHSNKNELWQGINFKDMAYGHINGNEYAMAYEKIDKAIRIFEKLREFSLYAEAVKIKGIIMRALERYDESITCFQRALYHYYELDIPFQSTEVLFQLGILHKRMGDSSRAISYIDKAIEIAEKLKAPWLLTKFDELLREIDEGEWFRLCLKRYLGDCILDSILKSKDAFLDSGARMIAAILFVNLKLPIDYISVAKAEDIVSLFNEYFGQYAEIVAENGGVVEGFIGDEMMAYFGVPHGGYNDSYRCVESAGRMLQKTIKISERRKSQVLSGILASAGINTGEVYAGNIGAYLRMQFKVTGSAVNLASRLLHKAKPAQVLMSETTYSEVKDKVPSRELPPMQIKGLKTEQRVWELQWERL